MSGNSGLNGFSSVSSVPQNDPRYIQALQSLFDASITPYPYIGPLWVKQGTPVYQPTGMNGLPCMYITNGNYYTGTPVFTTLSYFLLIKFVSVVNNAVMLSATGASFGYLQYGSTWYIGDSYAATVAPKYGQPELKEVLVNGSSATRYTNGVSHGAQSITGALQINGIGPSGGYAADFCIAESVFYNRCLTTDERVAIENYYKQKYNL